MVGFAMPAIHGPAARQPFFPRRWLPVRSQKDGCKTIGQKRLVPYDALVPRLLLEIPAMKLLPSLFFCLALPTMVCAEEKAASEAVAKVNLSQFKFGKTISGTEVTAESLKGSPVIVEFWGVNCGPCLAAMPTFNSLAKRHESKGLKVIGAESQNSTEEEVKKIVKSLKIKFPVTAGATHPLSFSGIPHSAVFGADGTMLFEGHPSDKGFERAVKDALKTASPVKEKETSVADAAGKSSDIPLVAERTWTNAEGKPVTAALLKVESGQGTFRRKEGKTFTYAIDKLSSSDQDLIAKAQQP
jgi:thiol-disulfide isomerase/thioredoxin